MSAVVLQGLIFCVGVDSGVLKLYDIRSYDKGPFDTFVVCSQPIISTVQYSLHAVIPQLPYCYTLCKDTILMV